MEIDASLDSAIFIAAIALGAALVVLGIVFGLRTPPEYGAGEGVEYPEDLTFEHGRWDALGGEARSSFATALRMTIMRSARSYSAPALALFERAVTNEHTTT